MKWHSFSEVVTDATSKFTKIKASDYHAQGKYKIIDQGKEPIAGYTDDPNLVNGQLLPILIFGDHTRILKYEDNPIALGADGAKALWVNPDVANARYVYYYLRSIHIKEAGYSRHFKFLKEVRIPIPFKDGISDLDNQKRIARLLDKVEGLIAQRKQHLQQLDDLLKSVFLEMFGDPVRNEKGWNVVFWDDLFVTRTGKLNANAMSENGAYPFFTCAKEIFQIDKFAFDCEALILAGNNASGDYDVKYYEGKFNAYQRTYILELKNETDRYPFYKHHLEMKLRQLKDGSKGANTRYLTKQFLDTICFIQPREELQKRFSAIAEKIDRIKSRYQQNLTDLEKLYGALSQQAFKGELDLSRIPLEKLANEDNATVKKKLRLSVEPSLSKNFQDTLANLNTFNQTAASHFKALEEANRLSKLPWEQLNSVSRLAEQFASFRSPLQELGHMSTLSKTFEQAQAALKPLNIDRLESLTKTAELARSLAFEAPKIDFGRLSLHDEFVKKANEPLESLRRTIEQFQMPSASQHFSDLLSEQLETAKRFQSTIPDFTTWQKLASEVPEIDFEESDRLFSRHFEPEDVVGIVSSANEPLSFESLLQELGEFNAVDFAGYERIKAIIFDLLATNQLKQVFDENQKTLFFSAVVTVNSQ